MKTTKVNLVSIAALALPILQTSCIVAGGYSSNGGWYIWPGSLISLLVIAVVVILLLKRRR
jgi:hypothetical protein